MAIADRKILHMLGHTLFGDLEKINVRVQNIKRLLRKKIDGCFSRTFISIHLLRTLLTIPLTCKAI
jgi:hypothetical protein